MNSPTILIVDDEPFNVDYLEQELEESGCKTVSAANGQEALEQVYSSNPDLILLDIMMPVVDGFEVLSRLKADDGTRDIPVIVISANNDLQSVVRCIEMGAEDYLPKPFEPVLLHARMMSCLEKKRLRDLQQLYLKSLEREMDIAREIQAGFLPTELPRVAGWEIAAYFKAAREVSGDFFDAFILPDGNLALVIGDVCGKGIGAALFMTLFRSLTRAALTNDICFRHSGELSTSPAGYLLQAISFTNRYICNAHGDAGSFATLFLASLDPQQGTLTYINGGNEAPLLLQTGCVAATLLPTGPVIGVFEDAAYKVKEVHLEKNDLLVAFTDGIPDSQNETDEFLGHERLMDLVTGEQTTASNLLQAINLGVDKFRGAAHQFDDITLMAVKRCE